MDGPRQMTSSFYLIEMIEKVETESTPPNNWTKQIITIMIKLQRNDPISTAATRIIIS